MATIVLRGSTMALLDDIERAIDNGVNAIKSLIRDNRLVAGAGATEMYIANEM
jgi:T-complex protein 1 subunit theta